MPQLKQEPGWLPVVLFGPSSNNWGLFIHVFKLAASPGNWLMLFFSKFMPRSQHILRQLENNKCVEEEKTHTHTPPALCAFALICCLSHVWLLKFILCQDLQDFIIFFPFKGFSPNKNRNTIDC